VHLFGYAALSSHLTRSTISLYLNRDHPEIMQLRAASDASDAEKDGRISYAEFNKR
jgi:hypothetical protein